MATGYNYRRITNTDQLVFDSAGSLVGVKSGESSSKEFRGVAPADSETLDDMLGNYPAIELLIAQMASDRAMPLWNGVSVPAVQFRGTADTAASLGALGFVFNAAGDAEAAVLLETSNVDEASLINGASLSGAWYAIELPAYCESVHVGVMGMTPPYAVATSGTVDAASTEFMRWDFAEADQVRWVFVQEGPPTNFAGTPGTGSARMVTVYGVVEVVE